MFQAASWSEPQAIERGLVVRGEKGIESGFHRLRGSRDLTFKNCQVTLPYSAIFGEIRHYSATLCQKMAE
jgi:hypothetical protein